MYQDKGAHVAASRADVFAADVILQIRATDAPQLRQGQIVIGMMDRSARRRRDARWRRGA